MVQRAESVTLCGTCQHPKEAHLKWKTEGVLPSLPLREHCVIHGCSCRSYVGLLWEGSAS